MARLKTIQNNFTSGEISPYMAGRGDLAAYLNGAATLKNVRIHPTGGLSRRAGLRYVANAPGNGRLIAFEFNTEQVYLLLFSHKRLDIYANDSLVRTLYNTPWSQKHLPALRWTQSADTLLLTHPDIPPKKLLRKGQGQWMIADWVFYQKNALIYQPYFKFHGDEVTLQPSATTGNITLTASHSVFSNTHRGTRFRIDEKQVEIQSVQSGKSATAVVREKLKNTSKTEKWDEQVFSEVRGYPVCVCFHQDRLVIGGSRDLPNRLWLSQSSALFNFDLGEGLDAEAIEFAILSDQVNAICGIFSGRHLQVFTSGAEWMVTGTPLTPSNIQLNRQTRIGSPVDRYVPPRDVDGATLFVARNNHDIREFLFTDTEQAYQSNDLTLLAKHMITRPVDQDFCLKQRRLFVVLENGKLATLTLYRAERVTAWSTSETSGHITSIAVTGDTIYLLVRRGNRFFLECFDEKISTDSARKETSTKPQKIWSGFSHLEQMNVNVVADGIALNATKVVNGKIQLERAAREIEVGRSFSHVIEPLPIQLQPGRGTVQGASVRLVRAIFRLTETAALSVDIGSGLVDLPFRKLGQSMFDKPIPLWSGDKIVRALGWRRHVAKPLWRIEQSTPLPSNILSVVTEVSANG